MDLDELQQVWKSQKTRVLVETALVLESVRKKQRRHQISILLRDLREGWLTILAAAYFAVFVESDAESWLLLWPFYLAMAILFGMGVFRVLDNRRQKRRTLHYRDSTLSFIECSLRDITHRIWLLENIFWWAILPLSVIGILIVVQIIMLVGWQEPAVFLRLGQGVGIGCVILSVLYWGNLRTVRKYWGPRKDELLAISKSLEMS